MAVIGSGVSKRFIGNSVSSYNANEGRAWTKTNANDFTTNAITPYPRSLPLDKPVLNFNFFKYSRPSVLNSPTLIPYGNIILPIPNDLKDRIELNYSEESLGPLVAQSLSAAKNTYNNAYGAEGITGTNLLQALGQAGLGGGLVEAVQRGLNAFGGALGQQDTANKVVGSYGWAINPFMSILFKSPKFKTFNMSWVFIPENKEDTDQLNFIFNKFRYHSLPSFASDSNFGKTFFGYPDMVKPQLLPAGYFYDFKFCCITNVSMDYVPGDTPAFQAQTRAPVAYKLDLQLLEIELWTKDDVINSNNLAGPGTVANNNLTGSSPIPN